ncbi:MAG: MgtC/SapB family protein [Bacteroidota bacterium]
MDLSIDLIYELIIIAKLILSFLLGGFIGYDREKRGKDAGIRTYAAVCLGATIFVSIAEHLTDDHGASRVIANIIVGIGFLGSGIITQRKGSNYSHGLTTAATVWCTAAIGVAIGMNMFLISLFCAATLYFLLSLDNYKWYARWKKKMIKQGHMEKKE